MRETATPPALKLHLLRAIPIVIVLGLLVHFLLPRLGTIAASLETLKKLVPWAIAMSVLMETLSYVTNGLLLQSVIDLAGDKVSLKRAAAIEIGAGSVAIVAAGALGFGAAIYKWVRNGGVSADAAFLATWLPPMFDSAALILFALISALELLFMHQLSRLTETALIIVVSLLGSVLIAAILLLARRKRMEKMTTFLTRWIKRVRPGWDESEFLEIADSGAELWQRMRRGEWIRPAACSLMTLTFDLLCLRYAFLATGHSLRFSYLIGGYGVPMLLGRASFLPGGIAIIEVTMAALFGGLGVPASVAVVAVLTYRLISFWIPSLLGIPIAVTLHSK